MIISIRDSTNNSPANLVAQSEIKFVESFDSNRDAYSDGRLHGLQMTSNLLGDRLLTCEDDEFVLKVDIDIRGYIDSSQKNR